jgi:prepilin-type processing-associated H-X9-DG protein
MRHNRGANVVYGDGHVATESYKFLLYGRVYNYPLNAAGLNLPYKVEPPGDAIFDFSPY